MTGERGSASIWVVTAAALVLVAGLVGALRARAVYARHRAEAAADLAALAAAGQIGIAPQPCAPAAAVATANGATLTACRSVLDADGRSGVVTVAVRVGVAFPVIGPRWITASARAARLRVAGGQQSAPGWLWHAG